MDESSYLKMDNNVNWTLYLHNWGSNPSPVLTLFKLQCVKHVLQDGLLDRFFMGEEYLANIWDRCPPSSWGFCNYLFVGIIQVNKSTNGSSPACCPNVTSLLIELSFISVSGIGKWCRQSTDKPLSSRNFEHYIYQGIQDKSEIYKIIPKIVCVFYWQLSIPWNILQQIFVYHFTALSYSNSRIYN